MTFNDGVLKACLLRAARKSDLMYEVDPGYSNRILEIVLAEIAGWPVGTGDALPEMLVALATGRLRLRETDSASIRTKALGHGLSGDQEQRHPRAIALAQMQACIEPAAAVAVTSGSCSETKNQGTGAVSSGDCRTLLRSFPENPPTSRVVGKARPVLVGGGYGGMLANGHTWYRKRSFGSAFSWIQGG